MIIQIAILAVAAILLAGLIISAFVGPDKRQQLADYPENLRIGITQVRALLQSKCKPDEAPDSPCVEASRLIDEAEAITAQVESSIQASPIKKLSNTQVKNLLDRCFQAAVKISAARNLIDPDLDDDIDGESDAG